MIDHSAFTDLMYATGAHPGWRFDPTLGGRLDEHVLPTELPRMREDRVRATIGSGYTLPEAIEDTFSLAFLAGLMQGERDVLETTERAHEQLLVDFLTHLWRDKAESEAASPDEEELSEAMLAHVRAQGFPQIAREFLESRR